MSYWIELHCDTDFVWRCENIPATPIGECACYTDRGSAIGIKVRNLTGVMQHLRREACVARWRKVSGIGWCCPVCVKAVEDTK